MSYPINVTIPNGPNDPADDQNLIRQNFGNIANYLAVDHIAAGAADNGYHSVIHSVPYSSGADPSAITGIGQLYTKTVGSPADQQLFYESGNGVVSQLSGASATGSTVSITFPNGIIFKWGFSNAINTMTSGTITYPVAFPNATLNVTGTLFTTAGTSNENTFAIKGSLAAASFNWDYTGSAGSYNGFYWFAIGY